MSPPDVARQAVEASPAWTRWQCFHCGYVYDEALGWPKDGIAPGTRWADVPDDWGCPDCGAMKSDFAMVEID